MNETTTITRNVGLDTSSRVQELLQNVNAHDDQLAELFNDLNDLRSNSPAFTQFVELDDKVNTLTSETNSLTLEVRSSEAKLLEWVDLVNYTDYRITGMEEALTER